MPGKPTYEELKQSNKELEKEAVNCKRTEEVSRECENRFKNVINSIEELLVILDQNFKIQLINTTLAQAYNVSLDEYMGKHCYEFFYGRNDICEGCPAIKVLNEGKVIRGALRYRPDGRIFDRIAYPFIDDNGNITSVIVIGCDITQQRQAEEDLRKNEKKYRFLVNNIPGIVYRGYKDWSVEFFDNKIESLTGYDFNEFNSKRIKWIDIFIEEDIEAARESFIQALKTDKSYVRKYRIKSKTGGITWIQERGQIVCDNKGEIEYVSGIFFDITETKRIQEERNLLTVAIEQAAESVFITDRNGTIQYVNPSFEHLTGYRRKDAIGRNPRILKSGKQDALFYKQMWDTLTRGDAWHGRFINKKKDGSFYEADATISPVLDKSGKITNYVYITRDITHEIELEKRLVQSHKMESIGTLAGGIAHNFNNILGIIIPNAELAIDDVPEGSPAKECLNEIRSASLRAKDMVQQILNFARKSLTGRKPVQISPIIKDSLKLLRASIPSTIEIRRDISCEFETVFADPTQISQVLMNLCTNAAQAMGEQTGVLKVILKNVEFENQDSGLDVKPGRYVALTVSDTGHGIKPEIIDRIYEPYFTTKEVDKGTGMGLSVVHGIVKSYDGIITVNSEPGKGTVFEVLLPVFEAETEQKGKEPEALPTGNEKILFIDDEESIVKVVQRILEHFGYQVEAKTNPVEALELFRSRPDRFDLVITDMTMPKMTGENLVQEILNIRAEMPIILCTGYHEKISEEKARKLGIKAFVFKPFVPHNFALTVRSVLDEK